MRRMTCTIAVALCAAVPFAAAQPAALPNWIPAGIFGINPDNLTVEDFGQDEFKIANGSDSTTVEAKGRHWAGSLYPPGAVDTWDKWSGETAWQTLRPQLERQGFKVVYLKADPGRGVDVTLRKGAGDAATYVELTLTNDAYSNSIAIVEPAAHTRTLTLTPPAAQPEAVGDRQDFPYLTPLEGAKLLDTHVDDSSPLDVTTAADKEPHLVGSGVVTKQYEGPPRLSPIDFVNTYEPALKAAGWQIVERDAGDGFTLIAHYARNNRDIWTRMAGEGADRWNISVADVGTGMKKALEAGCKVALYGITFDFDKTTLRPESDPVLQQAAAAISASGGAFEIDGHTDNVGAQAYNLKLSQGRADAVKDWLVAHGIAADRLTTKGYGDAAPVAPNTSDANRARNRRVELKKAGCS